MNVLIFGAGSIGNHLANACVHRGHTVTIADVDRAALWRTEHEIYPGRYGKWNSDIRTCLNSDIRDETFDLVLIGTPPNHHIDMAKFALRFNPKAILLEKPICAPGQDGLLDLVNDCADCGVTLFTGYDHSVSKAFYKVRELIETRCIGKPVTLDVEFREYWGGIFKAHPWLNGPQDSYLGYWRSGGGATGEHSHALHLYVVLLKFLGLGEPEYVDARMHYESKDGCDYDAISLMTITSASGALGRCVQDVVTEPPRKWCRIQGTEGFIEFEVSKTNVTDVVTLGRQKSDPQVWEFSKTRPDDFIQEISHIERCLNGDESHSPLDIQVGLTVMRVIEAAYRSSQSLCSERI